MITIESPSMSVNDSRAVGPYPMDLTITVQSSTTMQNIVDSIVRHSNTLDSGVIKNLILTAHGLPGSFQLGTGLNINTMAPFADINGKVFKVWFRGCLVARIIDSQTASQGDGAALQAYNITSGNGHSFVSAFARLTGCYVVAPTEMQSRNSSSYPSGQMDSYEGLVLSYDPEGNLSWQERYPSLYRHNTTARRSRNPNRE